MTTAPNRPLFGDGKTAEPALLTRSEIEWLLNNENAAATGKTSRDMRYRINRKLKIFLTAELPLLISKGFVRGFEPTSTAIAAIPNANTTANIAASPALHVGGRGFESHPVHY